MIVCQKHRDPKTGEILGAELPTKDALTQYDNYIIVDDIIDGGKSFLTLGAKLAEATGGLRNKYLIVTHGIFSKGFNEISQTFNTVFTTNSYQELFSTYNLKVYDVFK